MTTEIIPQTDIPSKHRPRNPEIREILDKLKALTAPGDGMAVQHECESPREAKNLRSSLFYYRDLWPDLRACQRGNLVFCWREGPGKGLPHEQG